MIDLTKLNLKVTYKNLFKFMNENKNAKDLIEVVTKKQAIDFETMVQLIYVSYLGSEVETKLSYDNFLDNIDFDFTRDSQLFAQLINNNLGKN